MYKKKWIKKAIAAFLLVALLVTGITVTILQGSPKSINATGSSSMLPVYSGYANIYDYDNKIKENVNLNVSSGGSGKGLNDISYLNTDIGNMSSREKDSITGDIATRWEKNHIRTVTIARDAIGLIVKLPTGVTINPESPVKDANRQPSGLVNILELAKLYDFQEHDLPTWKELLGNSIIGPQSALDSKVAPFGRTGGKEASGTSDAFFSGLEKWVTPDMAKKLDINHSATKINKTQEANSAALNSLTNSQEGITYLSLGYAENAVKENPNIHLTDIEYQKAGAGPQTISIPSTENVMNGSYTWVRPFNSAFSITDSPDYVKNFIEWSLLVALDPKEINVKNPNNPFPVGFPASMTLSAYQQARKSFDEANCISLDKEMVLEQLKSIDESDYQLWNDSNEEHKVLAFGLDLDNWGKYHSSIKNVNKGNYYA